MTLSPPRLHKRTTTMPATLTDPASQLEDRLAMATAYGLQSLNSLRMLIALSQRGPMTLTALAGVVGLTPAAMTCSIDRLEKKELVRRTRGSDRRAIPVEITDSGRSTVNAITALP